MLEVVLLESWKVLKTAGEFWKGNKGTEGLLSRKLIGGCYKNITKTVLNEAYAVLSCTA